VLSLGENVVVQSYMCFRDKALGHLHAIQWVHDLTFLNVNFELDAKKVVDFYIKGKKDILEFGEILEECKRCCNLYFENLKVEFSRRKTNDVAHNFAREAVF